MAFDPSELHGLRAAGDLPFRIRKIGHVVIRASDLRKSAEFYTQLLGFEISDIYPESMVPGGMVFMRCNPDHHGVALVGGMPGPGLCRTRYDGGHLESPKPVANGTERATSADIAQR